MRLAEEAGRAQIPAPPAEPRVVPIERPPSRHP
jgi:hypothetical protein